MNHLGIIGAIVVLFIVGLIVLSFVASRQHHRKPHDKQQQPPVTVSFIVPSIGRTTLSDTLQTLQSMTVVPSVEWEALVVFDGVSRTIDEQQQIKVMEIDKCGQGHNSAGLVRNAGIQQCTSDWVAFVDDDDRVTPDYLVRFKEEWTNHPEADVILFRMQHGQRILPHPERTDFRKNDVGISFAMKRSVALHEPFQPSETEDFDLLDRLRTAGYSIRLSPHVTYWVRP